MEDLGEQSQLVEEKTNDFSLIDVSGSDDDFLLAYSSEVNIVDNPGDAPAQGAHTNKHSDSQNPKKNGKWNLRKSLAWDSAFFTSAGVLDPEELSTIIEGAETTATQKPTLPGIQEDLSKSTDSISTFESDLTLESLEADLFCDIRASIQRSSRSCTPGNSKSTRILEGDSSNRCLPKIIESPTGNLLKPELASRKLNPGVQGPGKSLKPAGSICKQVPKPALRNKELSSLLPRHPAAAEKSSLAGGAATKRMSVGAARVKLESSAAGNPKGRGAPLPKVSYQADSKKTAPKPVSVSKYFSGSTILSRSAIRCSRSSCDSSGSSSSQNIRKSQADIIRKKMDNVVNLPYGSKARTPSRVTAKRKSQTQDSNISEFLKSASKLSPSVSPASSISEWSTESSSSTATFNQHHVSLEPCPDSSEDVSVDWTSQDSQNLLRSKRFGGHENRVVRLPSQSAKPPSTGIAAPLARPGSAKPSGLRMPSAKIGFFDGVKPGTKTPSSNSRSRAAVPTNLPRLAAASCSPCGAANKTKLGNTKTAAKVTPTISGIASPEFYRTDVDITSAVHLLDQSSCLQKASSAYNISRSSCELLEGVLPDSAVDKTGKVVEVVEEEKYTDDSGSGARNNNLIPLKKEASTAGKLHSTSDQAIFTAEEGSKVLDITDCTRDLSASPSSKTSERNRSEWVNVDNLNPPQVVSEADDLKDVSIHACQEVSGSARHENQDSNPQTLDPVQNVCVENQVGGEEKHVGGIDHTTELQRDRDGDFQSQSVIGNVNNSSAIILCPDKQNESPTNLMLSYPTLSHLEPSLVSRTPFTVKNSVCDVIDSCYPSSVSVVEPLVKADTLPSLLDAQKENT